VNAFARIVVIAIGVACLVLAVYNAVTPDRTTVGLFSAASDGSHARLIVAVPSPEAIPVHPGDELDVPATTMGQRQAYFSAALIGSTISVPIVRNGQHITVTFVVPPGTTTPPRWIDLVLVILEFAFSVAVMIRAGTVPLARMVVLLAIVEETGTVAFDFLYTAPTPTLAFVSGPVLGSLLAAGTSYVAVWAALMLPGGIRRRTPLMAAALAAISFITATPDAIGQAIAVPFPLLATSWLEGLYVTAIVFSFGLAIALAVVAQAAPTDQRMRSMWFVSTLVGWFIGSALAGLDSYFSNGAPALFWISYLLQSFTLLGPIYATLRHRILDLNFVITRSAVYAILSIVMLGSFAGAEWAAGKIADAVITEGFWRGVAAQLLSFSAALVIGLYLRSVHANLEDWVNGILFRERIRKLRALESFAREADLLQSRSELLRVTYEALMESIDADHVAVYTSDAGALVCAHGSGTDAARLQRSDRVVLQLLDRQGPFVSEVPSLRNWLIVPLTARREVIGAIACGPKRDRTDYLPDELRALNDVAQHVATTYALLLPSLGTVSPTTAGS